MINPQVTSTRDYNTHQTVATPVWELHNVSGITDTHTSVLTEPQKDAGSLSLNGVI